MEKVIKIAEVLIRVNSSSTTADVARHRWLAVRHDQRSSIICRYVRVSFLAKSLGLSLQLTHGHHLLAVDQDIPSRSVGSRIRGQLAGVDVNYVFGATRLWGAGEPFQSVQIFTNAYAPSTVVDTANTQFSAWAVCIGDDWLAREAATFPGPKDTKRLQSLRFKVSCFGEKMGPSLPAAGSYTPNLTAIAHALCCVPASWHVSIFCAKMALDAVHWFQRADTDRHRLRLCSSPLLEFIHAAISARVSAGGSALLVPYNDNLNCPSAVLQRAGYNMAHYCADRSTSFSKPPVVLLPPLASGRFLSCSAADGWKPVLGSFRKQLAKLDKASVLHQWSISSTQAKFCSAAAEPFVVAIRELVAQGDLHRHHLAFALRLLSNSVQFTVIEVGIERTFSELNCSLCDGKSMVDVQHLVTCSNKDSVERRELLASQLLDALSRADADPGWVWSMQRVSFFSLVQNLFSRGKADDQARCLRSAFGCFSDEELEMAVKANGVRIRPWLGQELRRLLLRSAYNEWLYRQPKANGS